jgi:hypothetical protein
LPRKTAERSELEDILRRIEESKGAFVAALEGSDKDQFESAGEDGESVKLTSQRAADEINFYYGRLVSRALNLPQPPMLTRADFGSPREAVAALQIAHGTFTKLLHDLVPEDLDKVADDPELGTYTLKQILELASAQYAMRAQQVGRLAAAPSG